MRWQDQPLPTKWYQYGADFGTSEGAVVMQCVRAGHLHPYQASHKITRPNSGEIPTCSWKIAQHFWTTYHTISLWHATLARDSHSEGGDKARPPSNNQIFRLKRKAQERWNPALTAAAEFDRRETGPSSSVHVSSTPSASIALLPTAISPGSGHFASRWNHPQWHESVGNGKSPSKNRGELDWNCRIQHPISDGINFKK